MPTNFVAITVRSWATSPATRRWLINRFRAARGLSDAANRLARR
jgi:hypothetical protein